MTLQLYQEHGTRSLSLSVCTYTRVCIYMSIYIYKLGSTEAPAKQGPLLGGPGLSVALAGNAGAAVRLESAAERRVSTQKAQASLSTKCVFVCVCVYIYKCKHIYIYKYKYAYGSSPPDLSFDLYFVKLLCWLWSWGGRVP